MNIALLGYGKMGKVIEEIALQRGHKIVAKIDKHNADESIDSAEVAINFSTPQAAVHNITKALNHRIPVVCGTTGWLDSLSKIELLCSQKKGAFLYASNFSLGVNLFFELNKMLSKLMTNYDHYQVSLAEIHHTQKQDTPSGTAITLAEDIISNSDHQSWKLSNTPHQGIPIKSVREQEVPGTHSVLYQSEVDDIEIKHTAHNRKGFGLGAVIAAEWITNKKGIFSMQDVLNLNRGESKIF